MDRLPSPIAVIAGLLFVGGVAWMIAFGHHEPPPVEGPVSGLHYEPPRGGPTGMRRLECYRVWVDTSSGQRDGCVSRAEYDKLTLGKWYRLP
jgi:hypothetical protein